MKKIKENIALKIVASLLLSICAVVGFLSGILVVIAFKSDYYNPGGKERLKNDIIDEICYGYGNIALDWYENVYYNENEDIYYNGYTYYEEFFSEENTNYFFSIEPLYEEDKEEYPKLSNYVSEDYQYKSVEETELLIWDDNITFSYDISPDNIETGGICYFDGDYYDEENYEYYGDYEAATVESTQYDENYVTEASDDVESGESYNEKYNDDFEHFSVSEDGRINVGGRIEPLRNYTTYEDYDGIHIVFYYDNYEINYNVNTSEYQKEFSDFSEEELYGYEHYSLIHYFYDLNQQKLFLEFERGDFVSLRLTNYVKSDLTAHDNFYSSGWLKFYVPVINAALPLFIISCILALVALIYIIVAAGHKKELEGIYLNRFHRIPYDLVVASYFILGIVTLYACDNIWMGNDVEQLLVYVLIFLPLVFTAPCFIYTTVARIKAGNMFANTVIWRVLKACGRFIKKLWRKVKSYGEELRGNINLYWKWIGAYALISLLELVICFGVYHVGFTLIVWCLEKLFIASILVVAIINMNKLKKGGEVIASGRTDYEIETENMLWEFKKHGENLNKIRDGIQVAVDERMKSEKMKTELITNVSHDIKTPLTSIINYVDLLSKEDLKNEKAIEYLEVLDRQSAKLKKLIQDLIDASKASTGNMQVEFADVDVKVLLEQSLGEFSDKLLAKGLKPIVNFHTDDTVVKADGKHLWRVFDNLINNISKYAQDNTRVYIDVDRIAIGNAVPGMIFDENVKNSYTDKKLGMLKVSFKNVSNEELNISGDELMERFVRGDKSRNTEGNGLGLSIAKSLMKIQNGDLQIIIDGDLFKVELLLM